jgi:hypothetical protein
MELKQQEIKVSLFADDIILNIKDPKKKSTPKLLDTMNRFKNVARYKINLQK